MNHSEPVFRSVADLETACEVAAREVARTLIRAVEAHAEASLVLAGGSTPRAIHRRLSDPRRSLRIPWAHVHLFWGDERCVPPGNDASNYAMARTTLIDHIDIPVENVHRIHGELPPDEGAMRYERELRRHFGDPDLPSFDCVMLGMGADGHTASLFPGDPLVTDTRRWVGSTDGTQASPPVPRVSLTLPAINAAQSIVFVVSGEEKRRVVREIEEQAEGADRYPAARVRASKSTLWIVAG